MNDVGNEESDFSSAAERHHQIMVDGTRFFRHLFFGCLSSVVLIAGTVIFFLFRYHPFWRYP